MKKGPKNSALVSTRPSVSRPLNVPKCMDGLWFNMAVKKTIHLVAWLYHLFSPWVLFDFPWPSDSESCPKCRTEESWENSWANASMKMPLLLMRQGYLRSENMWDVTDLLQQANDLSSIPQLAMSFAKNMVSKLDSSQLKLQTLRISRNSSARFSNSKFIEHFPAP